MHVRGHGDGAAWGSASAARPLLLPCSSDQFSDPTSWGHSFSQRSLRPRSVRPPVSVWGDETSTFSHVLFFAGS